MTKPIDERITESRRLLHNPYAYLNDLGSYSASPNGGDFADPLSDKVGKSRRLLQDPYAHLNDFGVFSALPDSTELQRDTFRTLPQEASGKYSSLEKNTRKKHRYSNIEIEDKVINLQKRMWQDRSQIWLNPAPSNPIDILDPSVALRLIGYDYDLNETLGQYCSEGRQIEVAGIIDDSLKRVRISRKFPCDVRNFTAAHELGHALLHDARGLHRDRPVDGAMAPREAIEFEADKFATYFLMPRKLVKACFKKIFATDVFSLNEETSFALVRGTSLDPEKDCKTLRDLSRILASAESYNGIHFISLANQFRVSTEAMAIRLEELELLTI